MYKDCIMRPLANASDGSSFEKAELSNSFDGSLDQIWEDKEAAVKAKRLNTVTLRVQVLK